jgi:hypothetical protein
MSLDTTTLLQIHRRAYELLMLLDQRASTDPEWLAPHVVDRLRRYESAKEWLAEHQNDLPDEFRFPPTLVEPFARLFSSFFETSFDVEQTTFQDKLLSARLRRGKRTESSMTRNTLPVVALALKHVLALEGIRLDARQTRSLAGRSDIHTETRIVAYIWELDRRVRGKAKGPVVHKLWLSLPVSVRKSLDDNMVWLAKDAVRRAAAAHRSESRP